MLAASLRVSSLRVSDSGVMGAARVRGILSLGSGSLGPRAWRIRAQTTNLDCPRTTAVVSWLLGLR